MQGIRERWRRFWMPPDSTLLQTGGQGEKLISWGRLSLSFAAIAFAFVGAWITHRSEAALVYLAVTYVSLPLAGLLHLIVSRADYRWSIGFVTSALDVSIVSITLAAFLLVDRFDLALMNPVAFPVYFLALSATSMRLDHRACAVAGALAVVQYGAIVGAAVAVVGVSGLGTIELAAQGARIALLGAMGILGTLVNLRMQKPHVLSANDGLTGLLNRHAFEDRWSGEVARARRYGRPISIAAIDIDYFKHFNDTHGHAAGDLALQSVARVIRSRVRGGDFVARLGGEEFVVALPETNTAAALRVAEQLREAVANHKIALPGGRTPESVTISIGVASWPDHGEEVTRLLDRADDRLYEAKLAGRDQVKGPQQRIEREVAGRF
ncbi:MAG: GGDEF domain-containing protein [marine benthic group bacterium]|nr:GGDEF domain-containing protein [Candidatus Carthagonibacter metallireducens]